MFTGIIAATGSVLRVTRDGDGILLEIVCPWSDLEPGESVAVDGACLTVTHPGAGRFGARVVATSLDRTRFGRYVDGQAVNLERALQVGDRLGGHFVQGHVDGVGRVRSVVPRSDAVVVDLEVPPAVARISAPLGSVTVDGVSLTIIALPEPDVIRLSLVPYTLQATTLGRLGPGSEVHVEGDLIGRHVAALMERQGDR